MGSSFNLGKKNKCKTANIKSETIRYCIKQAFGMCKGRFRLLNRPNLKCAKDNITRATKFITAIFMLYNFLIDLEDEEDDIEVDRRDIDIDINDGNEISDEQDLVTRDTLRRHTHSLIN